MYSPMSPVKPSPGFSVYFIALTFTLPVPLVTTSIPASAFASKVSPRVTGSFFPTAEIGSPPGGGASSHGS